MADYKYQTEPQVITDSIKAVEHWIAGLNEALHSAYNAGVVFKLDKLTYDKQETYFVRVIELRK